VDKYKIMIVDDEEDVREGIVSRINWDKLGYVVAAVAENGQDALEKAENYDLDVVLTDIKMPFMNGLDMSAQLTRRQPGIKIIILSGFEEFEYAKAAIKLNVLEYVLKPINVAELTEVFLRVKQLLDNNIAEQRDIEALRDYYQRSLPIMRERFLTELLWGVVPDDEISNQQRQYKLSVDGMPYLVALAFQLDEKADIALSLELAPISVKRVIEEQFAGRCLIEAFISSSIIAAVTAWDTPNRIGEIQSIANEVCTHCLRAFGFTISAGIGRACTDMRELHNSFSEARSALEYKHIAGYGKAIYIRDMEVARRETPSIGAREEENLLFAIKFGSKKQLEDCIDSFLLKQEDCLDWEKQAYALSLFSVIYRIAQRYELTHAKDIYERLHNFISGYNTTVTGATKEKIFDICTRMSEYLRTQRETAAQNLAQKAKAFIDAHYYENDLSVERVCEYLHVSPSYFSTIFRQETGRSYIQYLTELRLNKAVELLRATDEKTYIIARQVGYDEPNYFSYVFKKRFGVSPTRYRQIK